MQGTHRLPSILLVILTLVILSSSVFALFKLHELRSIERSPFIAIVSTNLGIKPKLLNVLLKGEAFIAEANDASLNALHNSYQINRASILNDLNSQETQLVHQKSGDLEQLNAFISKLEALEDALPQASNELAKAKRFERQLERLYQKWNVYSRRFVQNTQDMHDGFLTELDRALTLLLTLLVIIGATSVLAALLIYRQYRQQWHLSRALLRQTQALTQARDEAEAGIRAKSRFLSSISHELRTPLNGVIGLSNLAYQRTQDPDTRTYLKNIKLSGDLLLSLINNVLDINKMESGSLELEQAEFDLWEVIETVGSAVYTQAEEKGIYFVPLIAPDVPRFLIGDATRFKQILINLVGNAIKFTDTGGVTLALTLMHTTTQATTHTPNRQLQVNVSDTGIGISQSVREHIFEEFAQADSSTTRRFGGTGLGLSICRTLVNLMGGVLNVESEEGQGSQFAFRIPLKTGKPYRVNLIPRRIHLVISHHDLHDKIADDLRRWGQIVTDEAPDVCLFYPLSSGTGSAPGQPRDVEPLPNDLRQQLHHQGHDKTLVLIAPPDIADAYLPQLPEHSVSLYPPFTTFKLLNALAGRQDTTAHLATQATNEMSSEGSLSGTREDEPKSMPLAGKRILLVEDTPINQMVSTEFAESLGAEVTLAENGEECLARMAEASFDLILMDIHMPVLDGVETTLRIRQQAQWADLPIIALTANVIQEDVDHYFEVGMNGYLAKPFNEQDFERVLCQTLEGHPPSNPSQLS